MASLRSLRWKLFVSHLLILVVGLLVLLATAHYLAGTPLVARSSLTLSAAASEVGAVGPPQATSATSPAEAFIAVVDQAVLVATSAALITAVIMSWYVSRWIIDPLNGLLHISERMAQGAYQMRTVIDRDDEVGRLSQSINRLADALDQVEQRRMALITDVAHELRTPLMAIEGYLEGLSDELIPADDHTFGLLRHETSRMKRLIADLGLLSRAEAGQLTVHLQAVDLGELLTQLAAQIQPQSEADQLQLDLSLPADLPPVRADPQRLEQVLINVLVNALRYTPAGGTITIAAMVAPPALQVMVRDTGLGIAEDHLPYIFERFYRADPSRARASGGAGVGLAIADHLMQAQGGAIWAESAGLGQGATFFLTLPLYGEPDQQAGA